MKKSQMRIQQMAFMILAVFFFFTLVGLFLLQVFLGEMRTSAQEREREQVLNILESFSQLPEFSCSERSSFCIDEDKIFVMKIEEINQLYSEFWPISSIRIFKIGGNFSTLKECPSLGCNYYKVYENPEQTQQMEYSSYVSICKKIKDSQEYVYNFCELGKISIGMKIKS